MSKIIFTLIIIFYINSSLGQVFITVDNDTNEFIEDVNYSLFLQKKQVFSGITENKKITQIDNNIEYDSIALSRIDYNAFGLQKKNIDSIIYLTKKIIYLGEVVIGSKKDNYVLFGETNRFVKKQSRPIARDTYFGIVHKNESNKKIEIKKVVFFTEKIYYKTAYKINFYEVSETLPMNGNQYAEIGNLISSTDTLYIDKKGNSKNEINIDSEIFLYPNKPLFVSIQLINYFDESNNKVDPTNEYKTKLKFQLSNRTNFYSKTLNFISKEMSPDFLNINLLINYDFANEFYMKPHKSILVSPAILLYAKSRED